MRKQSILFIFAGLLIAGASSTTWAGDAATDKAQLEMQAPTLSILQKSLSASTGYKASNIEVTSTAHIITVTVINSKLNAGNRGDREMEAQKIASQVEKIISGKSEFSQIGTIHVDYVARQNDKLKIIQGIDFNKSQAGHFQMHKS